MTKQTIPSLSVLLAKGDTKVRIPVITILLLGVVTLISPSLAWADSPAGTPQPYARVWNPTSTKSVKLYVKSWDQRPLQDDGKCIPSSPGGYYDLGWLGQANAQMSIYAYNQPNCPDGSAIGFASYWMFNGGDCWFDIPTGKVTGVCVNPPGTLSPTATPDPSKSTTS